MQMEKHDPRQTNHPAGEPNLEHDNRFDYDLMREYANQLNAVYEDYADESDDPHSDR